jgi:hypothetical protein
MNYSNWTEFTDSLINSENGDWLWCNNEIDRASGSSTWQTDSVAVTVEVIDRRTQTMIPSQITWTNQTGWRVHAHSTPITWSSGEQLTYNTTCHSSGSMDPDACATTHAPLSNWLLGNVLCLSKCNICDMRLCLLSLCPLSYRMVDVVSKRLMCWYQIITPVISSGIYSSCRSGVSVHVF